MENTGIMVSKDTLVKIELPLFIRLYDNNWGTGITVFVCLYDTDGNGSHPNGQCRKICVSKTGLVSHLKQVHNITLQGDIFGDSDK